MRERESGREGGGGERKWWGTPKERQVAGSPRPFSRIKVRTREATYPGWRSCLGLKSLKKKKKEN